MSDVPATPPPPFPGDPPPPAGSPEHDPDHEREHEEDEPVWAAFLSYETYEQVARKVLRAGTEVAREGYQRHDAAVVAIALAMIVAGGVAHRELTHPPLEDFDAHGLHFRRTTTWLASEPVPPSPVRLIPNVPPPPKVDPGELPYHVEYTAHAGDVRLEVWIDKRPAWSNILTGLELERRGRYGELYASDGGGTRSIAGHDWLRTAYRYAHAPEKGDPPRIGTAVEYATVDREQIYTVTFHGTADQIGFLEDEIAPTLRVASRTGVPLLPQNRITQVQAPDPVREAMAATVMVVVADVIDGRLRAVGGGSGVVVTRDGSIVTNYHVVHDKGGRVHDLFVIGRHVEDGRPPVLVCAGRPRRAKLQPELDLALLKCDLDLDGRPWRPGASAGWRHATPLGREEIGLGQRLWVLGYPDVGGGSITLSQGLVEGWTGEAESLARDFIKTDASITHGNSGGPVVDDQGRVVGIATAFRLVTRSDGKTVETTKTGLVRPWAALADLMAIARTGWTPRDGMTAIAIEPTAVEVPAEGVMITTRIRDAASARPVAGAMLVILRPGISANEVDVNRLDDQAIAWARANAEGSIFLKQPVPAPGTYTVVVIARGYEPLLADGALALDDRTPATFDPWGWIDLRQAP